MGSFLSDAADFIGRASGDTLEAEAAGSLFSGVLPDCLGTVGVVVGASADPGLGPCEGWFVGGSCCCCVEENGGEVRGGALRLLGAEIALLWTVLTETRLGSVDVDAGMIMQEGLARTR